MTRSRLGCTLQAAGTRGKGLCPVEVDLKRLSGDGLLLSLGGGRWRIGKGQQ